MRHLFKIFLFASLLIVSNNILGQNTNQENIKFNKIVHNFGKILEGSGSRTCFFEFKNESNKPIVIYNVISSCGCTTPTWPKNPIMQGEGGKIKVTYLNDQGAIPFDKSLTVYTSANKKPIILRIQGIVYKKDKDLKELFPIKIGNIGLKSNPTKIGQMNKGESSSISITVANLSDKEIKVDLKPLSPNFKLSLTQSSILPNEIADISCNINTEGDNLWGNTVFKAKVICNDIEEKEELKVEAMILDNFSNLTKREKDKGSMVVADNSSYNFGTIRKGGKLETTFNLKNTGYSNLVIHKIDCDNNVKVTAPKTVKPNETFNIHVVVDTSKSNGDVVYTITLVTNSPNRPLVNLFLIGTVK